MDEEDNKYCGCLYYSANALARLMTKLAEEAFSETGLSPSYAFVLMIVNDDPGIQPGDIAQQMQLTPSTVTRLIDKLENKGYLVRVFEGRISRVNPTKKSLTLHNKLKAAWKALYKEYTDILGEEESRQLTDLSYKASKKLMN